MKIKFTDTPTPFITEFNPSEPLNTKQLLIDKEITVAVTHHTKTRFDISMQYKQFRSTLR